MKQFVILPSDRPWFDIARSMQDKGMPVVVHGDDYAIVAWHRGWVEAGVTTLEFLDPGEQVPEGQGWVRPDGVDFDARVRQQKAELDEALALLYPAREP